MKRPSDTADYQPPTLKNLLIGTAASLGIAAAVLVTVVMPAEYGIDPTGVGHALGLTALAQAAGPEQAVAPEPAPEPGQPEVAAAPQTGAAETFQPQQGEYRSDYFEVPLQPGQGLEFKVILSAGETLLYTWDAGGAPLYYDMHGEPLDGPKGFFLSYQEETDSEARGALRAPFEGTHGWYWRNDGDQPAKVRLKVSGFYQLPGES